jgi:2-phospho-L-lactate guanylyltransferase
LWSVVIPVKPLPLAKTRLRRSLEPEECATLVVAMAADTLSAALASPEVGAGFVVTEDLTVGAMAEEVGAVWVRGEPRGGLNSAVTHGCSAARARRPTAGVAVVSGDLPALAAEELTQCLRAARGASRAFLADAGGGGTTILTVHPGHELCAAFGSGSAAAHEGSGAASLPGAWRSLRRDVDTIEDLAAADRLGLGPQTRTCLRSFSLARHRPARGGGEDRCRVGARASAESAPVIAPPRAPDPRTQHSSPKDGPR